MTSKVSRAITLYLFSIVVISSLIPLSQCGKHHYPAFESKQYEIHEYHAPPPKKSAHVDINIPIDFGTIAKLGIIGLTQLKLLMALGKVAGAGLGVGALGLGSLGKIALTVGPKHGIAIDLGQGHSHSHVKTYEHHDVPDYIVDKRQYAPPKRHHAPERPTYSSPTRY